MKKENFSIDHKGIEKLNSIYCELAHLEQLLDSPILSPQLAKIVTKSMKEISRLVKPYRDFQDAEHERKYAYFDTEADKMNLDSVWSIYEVDDLDDLHPFSFTTIEYQGREISTGNTWRSLWKTSDDLIKLSGDEHHIFIEGFDEKDDKLILITGS